MNFRDFASVSTLVWVSLLAIELVVMVLLVFYQMTEMDIQSQLVVMAFEVNLELIPF